MKALGVEREGPDTTEVGDAMPCVGWRLACSSRFPGSSTGPRSLQRNIGKTGPYQGASFQLNDTITHKVT